MTPLKDKDGNVNYSFGSMFLKGIGEALPTKLREMSHVDLNYCIAISESYPEST